ncbi:MAG: sulfur carrier protein ThiS [Acidimicrobiales bacterium]|nr:sulfur carrier protein ThiS [Acidimicrobiales bacterium]MCB1259276.1 sulfur carrier protein ThiS [Acidimicrobiales bacterium]
MSTAQVPVVVNGEPTVVAAGTTIAALVAATVASPRGVAVARNDAVVPRSRWEHETVSADDRIELLTAAQGG